MGCGCRETVPWLLTPSTATMRAPPCGSWLRGQEVKTLRYGAHLVIQTYLTRVCSTLIQHFSRGMSEGGRDLNVTFVLTLV